MTIMNYGKPNFISFRNFSPPSRQTTAHFTPSPPPCPQPDSPHPALTLLGNYAIIYPLKAAMKQCAKVRFPERELYGEKLL